MAIPFLVLLLPYGLLLLVFFGLTSAHVYHVVRFGTFDTRNRLLLLVFFLYAGGILAVTVWYLATVDWSQSFSLPFLDAPPERLLPL